MTITECKIAVLAMQHFVNGGNLWYWSEVDKKWCTQIEFILPSSMGIIRVYNIIEDEHFEARKAFALGGKVEIEAHNNVWADCEHPTFIPACKYRPKKPVYEWLWYANIFVDGRKQTKVTRQYHTTLESVESKENCFHIWVKFESSKRERK